MRKERASQQRLSNQPFTVPIPCGSCCAKGPEQVALTSHRFAEAFKRLKVEFAGLNSTLDHTGWPPPFHQYDESRTVQQRNDSHCSGMVTRTDSLSGDVDVVGTSSRSRNTPETGRDGGRLVPTLRPGSVDGEEIRVREISFSHGVDSGLAGGETSSLGRMDTLSNHLESGLTLHADKPSSSPRNSVSAGEEISTRGRMDTLSDRPEGDLPPRADSTLRSPRNSIVVPMEVNDTAVDVVLDTASQVTVVSEEFAEHLKLTGVQGASLQGAARTGKMRSRIVHGVKLRFGDVECAWDIYVAPITDDVLLGLDFLEKHRAIVDLEQGVLAIGD